MQVTEVVAALIWDNGKFMICQRPPHKMRGMLWEFVGGKVEPGESKEEALVRECREELDVGISVGNPFIGNSCISGFDRTSHLVSCRNSAWGAKKTGASRYPLDHTEGNFTICLLPGRCRNSSGNPKNASIANYVMQKGDYIPCWRIPM